MRVVVHFVWATWDRHPLIEPEIEKSLHRYIAAICQDMGCHLLAINGTSDQVYLLTNGGTTCSLLMLSHV